MKYCYAYYNILLGEKNSSRYMNVFFQNWVDAEDANKVKKQCYLISKDEESIVPPPRQCAQ